MNPYRDAKPRRPSRRASSYLRAGHLSTFAMGLCAGVGFGPLSIVLALRLTAIPSPVQCESPPLVAPAPPAIVASSTAVAVEVPTAVPAPSIPPTSSLSAEQAEASIGSLAARAIKAIASRDVETLASMVDPEAGLELDPFGHDDDHRVLLRADLRGCFHDRIPRYWGAREAYHEAPDKVIATCAEYWTSFVYDLDFASATDLTYQETPAYGTARRPELAAREDEAYAQYFKQTAEGEPEALILAFTPHGKVWRLSRIVHQHWPEGE